MNEFGNILDEGLKRCKFCKSTLSKAEQAKQYCDACDKSLKEGTVKDYNKQAAKLYPAHPYYDRDTTDKDPRKDFDDSFKELKGVNDKLKKELEDGKSSKIYVDKTEEEEDAFENKPGRLGTIQPNWS